MSSPLHRCQRVPLPSHTDERGGLTWVHGGREIPFDIARVYYLYGTPNGAVRGAHAHKQLQQLFIAVAGQFEIELDDGHGRARYRLSDPREGLYVAPMLWRTLSGFSVGAVCMVLASHPYDEGDYYRDREAYLAEVRGRWS